MANPTPIDELTIEIDAKAQNANSAIDSLCKKIDILTTSISKVDVGKLNSLGSGIKRLGDSLQTMKSVDARSISSVVNKINSLSAIDTSKFATVSANLHQMANGIQSLGTVSANVASVGELASNISKLGNKSVQTAVTNIPQLATALKGLMSELSQSPKVSPNVIQMTNALANLTAQGSKVGSASNSIVKGLNRASASAERSKKSFKGLASAFGTFYANCFMVIRGVKSLWSSIETSMDYLETLNYFDSAFEQVAESADLSSWKNLGYASAEEYYSSFSSRAKELTSKMTGFTISESGTLESSGISSLGIDPEKLMNYQAMFGQMSSSMGVASETALELSNVLTMIGADLASVKNMDFDKVWTDMASGLAGMSRTLDKYGANIRNVNLQQKITELGINANITALNQNDKALLRTIILLDSTKYAWGDLAETLELPANQLRLLKSNFQNLARSIGNLFLPVLQKVLPYLNGVVVALQRLVSWAGSLMGLDLSKITSSIGGSSNDIGDFVDGVDDASNSLESAAENAKKLKNVTLGIDELNINSPNKESGSTSASTGMGTSGLLDEAFFDIVNEYKETWNQAFEEMQKRAENFADKIEKALEPVKKIFQDFAVGDFFQAGKDVSKLVVSITDFFARAINKVNWKGIGKKIGDFFAGIDWVEVFSSIGNLAWQGLKAAFELIVGAFSSAPIEATVASLVVVPGLLKKITSNQYVTKLQNLVTAFTKGSAAVSSFRDSLSIGQKIETTVFSGVLEYAAISDAVRNLKQGAENAALEIGKIGIAASGAAAVMYAALGPAGIAVAALVGLAGAISGAKKAQDEMLQEFAEAQEIDAFGETVNTLTGRWQETANAVRNNIDASREYVQDAGLAEMAMAQDLADRYFTLAEKSSLTNEEKAKMNKYAEELIKIFPDLAEVYDEEARKLDATRDAVNNLIDAKLKEYQLAAVEEQITEAYRQQIDAVQELEKANEAYLKAQGEMTQKQDAYNEAVGRLSAAAAYEEIGEAIRAGITSLDDFGAKTDVLEQLNKAGVDSAQDLKEIYTDLQDVLTKGGTEEIPTFKALGESVDDAELALEEFSKSYNEIQKGFFDLQSAEESASTYVDELVEMMTNGGEEIAGGAVMGYIDKVEADANELKKAGELMGDSSVEGTKESLNSHSPSKVYAEIGAYAVEGFNIGVSENVGRTISVMHTFVQRITGKFREVISPMYNIGVNVMQGLYNGLESMEGSLYAKAQSIADSIASTIRSALEIHSPSRVMAELGRYTIEGFKEGMENLYQPTLKSLQGFSYDVQVAPLETPKLNYNYGYSPIQSYTSSNYGNEIAGSVKQAIKEVVSEMLEPYLSDIAESNRTVADKDFSVAIGDREIYKANLRGAKASGRLLIT